MSTLTASLSMYNLPSCAAMPDPAACGALLDYERQAAEPGYPELA
jgi:hypothetical protein